MMNLTKLYVLAEKTGVDALQKRICRIVYNAFWNKESFWNRTKRRPYPGTTTIMYLYSRSHERSPLRRLVAEQYVLIAERGWWEQQETRNWLRTMPDFSVDLVTTWATRFADDPWPFDVPFDKWWEENKAFDKEAADECIMFN